MRNGKFFDRIVPLFFIVFTLFLFRSYVFSRKLVPLPFNLLVSYYPPWKYEEDVGFGIGVANKPLGYDNLKLFYPFRKFTTEQLSIGHIPLWNPYVFSGSVHHATYQAAVFYPLNIIYHLLPLPDAWSCMILIQPILTGWFTYLFLRSLKRTRLASLVGSFGFAYSGWMIAHWQEVLVISHSVMWLPLALYASNIRRGFFLLVLALSMSVLAGFPQMVVYVFGTVILWGIYRRKIITIGVSIIATLLLTAIQWLPALEAYLISPRAKVEQSYLFETFLSPLWHLVTFIVPDFWGNPGTYNYFAPIAYLQERTLAMGIGILLLALLALVIKNKEITFWKYFTIISLSLGFALPTSWIWYVLRVPILSVAQPVRIFVLTVFGLSVLSSYGFDHLSKKISSKTLLRIMAALATVFVGLWLFVGGVFMVGVKFPSYSMYITTGLRNLLFSSILFLVTAAGMWIFRNHRGKVFLVVILSSVFWVTYYSQKLLYFSRRQFEYPLIVPIAKLKEVMGLNRVWSYGDGYLVRNIGSYFGLYSPEGYEALYSHRYGALLNTIRTGGKGAEAIHRTDATLSETGQYEIMTNNLYRLRLMSLLSVKYVLEYKGNAQDDFPASKRFPSDLFTIFWQDDRWRIWEYKKSLPRAFFAATYLKESDGQKVIDRLYDPSIDLQKTVIIEDAPTRDIPTCCAIDATANAHVAIRRYEPESVDIGVQTDKDGFVFLSDTYFPGWKAAIDGNPTKIYRADYSFRAVEVPKGIHTVSFIYDPISWRLGVLISSMTLLVLVGFGMKRSLSIRLRSQSS